MAQTALAQTRAHGGNLWALMRQNGFSKGQIVDFSVDVNPFGFPDGIRSILLNHLDEIQCYPDPNAQTLREAIAAYHQVPVEMILPGNGSAELIGLVTRVRPFAKALVVVPTFTEYEWAAEQSGLSCLYAYARETNGFQLPPSATWDVLLRDVDLVFLCNPNNPTGVVLSKAHVLQIAQQCREAGALLVVDEAFVEFVDRPDEISVITEAIALGNVIVLRSLTKFFAVPGLRLGYVVAAEDIVETLRRLQSPWPLNTFALAVGAQLFKEANYIVRSKQQVAELREAFQRSLQALPGVQPFPSVTNFILCKLTTSHITASELTERMAQQGILIRNCDSFTGLEPGQFIRLAVRTQEDNLCLVDMLREALDYAG